MIIEKIIKNSPHLSWIKDGLILLVQHGSKAYNCHTEDSDDDYRGVCIPPKQYYYGVLNRFEQAELKDPDAVVYELQKFIRLATECNPNIMEILWVDESDRIFVSSIGEELISNRDLFLSKKIFYTMRGYAFNQIKRMKTHRNWLLNPVKEPLSRKEMGLPDQSLIPKDHLEALNAQIKKEIDKFNFDFLDNLTRAERIGIQEIMSEMLVSLKINSDDMYLATARKLGASDNLIEAMRKERDYENQKRAYKNYQEWIKNRNPKRAADEAKYGFDCYIEETEFLTESGWKKFDDIADSDKLATIFINNTDRPMEHRPDHLGIEFQNYTEKFDSLFTGNLYKLKTFHHECIVTPNHRMLIRKVERDSNKKYDWELKEVSNLYDTFEILDSVTPNKKNYSSEKFFNFKSLPIRPLTFLRLMGWYLSDGSASFRDNKIKYINISQIKNGKLYSSMKKFYNKYKDLGVSFYEYEREPNEFNKNKHIEAVLSIRNKKIINAIYDNCSNKYNKRIPRWVFKLSKQQMNALLHGLIGGDGTKKITENGFKYSVYYSTLIGLADDVQELAMACGYTSSLYGPYAVNGTDMYHIHINAEQNKFRKCIRSKNISKEFVKNKRIVCFTVPNSTLITRLNGHINFHGNCKHAYHVARLYTMCEEILSTGKVIVKRPDREMFMDIRNGKWSYDELMEFAENKNKKCEELYENSTVIPHSPNKKEIDKLCISLVEKGINLYK